MLHTHSLGSGSRVSQRTPHVKWAHGDGVALQAHYGLRCDDRDPSRLPLPNTSLCPDSGMTDTKVAARKWGQEGLERGLLRFFSSRLISLSTSLGVISYKSR